MQQRSDEWFASRAGHLTASRFADAVAKTKTGWGASRANYMAQLVAERLTGVPADSYSNAAMQWGTETEPQARARYELETGLEVIATGFILHPTVEWSGASPDGVVGDGLIEIKCPNTATHIDTLLNQRVPGKYELQMQWQMACTESAWCDFVSFDPRMPVELQFWHTRIIRDDERIAIMEEQAKEFLAEVAQRVEQLEALRNDPQQG